jgi:hypothetical protein
VEIFLQDLCLEEFFVLFFIGIEISMEIGQFAFFLDHLLKNSGECCSTEGEISSSIGQILNSLMPCIPETIVIESFI